MKSYKTPEEILSHYEDERFLTLVFKYLDHTIKPAEHEELQRQLKEDPSSRDAFVALLIQSQHIKESAKEIESNLSSLDDVSDTQILNKLREDKVEDYNLALKFLSQEENAAPTIEVPREVPRQELIHNVVLDKAPRKISRFTLVSAIVSAAALLFFVLFIKYIPPKQFSIEVATLIDQMDVKWVDSNVSFENGDRLWTNQMPNRLDKGIVKMQYDDGVEVVIEGPAKFTVERSGVYCEYGRLFSRVPQSGLGFLVETPTSRFVDMGTEFGVQADVNGSSELHVIKGKVQLFAGAKEKAKSSHVVTENQAMRYNANNSRVKEIPIQKRSFVRSIDSKTNTAWRGQMRIDLADIVGGGNGLGTGQSGTCIDTTTGQWKAESYLPANADPARPGSIMQSDYLLHAVKTAPFIDGVFIPDNDQGPVAITTLGHVFDGFPNTSGLGWGGILSIEDTLMDYAVTLNDERYGIPGKPALFMHGNGGITFDLAQIRDAFSGSLKGFTAVYGIADEYADGGAGCQPYADFWVLVDGQVRFCKKGVLVRQGGSISVELSEKDRFLTLVTTDGGQGSPEYDSRTSVNDWCLFGQPVLLTE